MLIENIRDRMTSFNGKMGICYIDINSGESCRVGNCDVFLASGAVKILTLLEGMKLIEYGTLRKNEKIKIYKNDYIQSSKGFSKTFGVLEFIHDGIELTIEDLLKLSTIVSDNTAFNVLLRNFGIKKVNNTLESLGFKETRVNREIYDEEKIKAGIENYISIKEMAELMYRLHQGQIISREASEYMLNLLKEHQKNNIIPYYFNEALSVAHQTGIDENVIIDLGIIYSKNPFVLCMAAEAENTRSAEGIMRDITLMCYMNSNKSR